MGNAEIETNMVNSFHSRAVILNYYIRIEGHPSVTSDTTASHHHKFEISCITHFHVARKT